MENLAKTNEAIANDIAKDWKMTYLAMENDGGTYDVDSFDDCYGAALEALRLKEKQFFDALKQLGYESALEAVKQLLSNVNQNADNNGYKINNKK